LPEVRSYSDLLKTIDAKRKKIKEIEEKQNPVVDSVVESDNEGNSQTDQQEPIPSINTDSDLPEIPDAPKHSQQDTGVPTSLSLFGLACCTLALVVGVSVITKANKYEEQKKQTCALAKVTKETMKTTGQDSIKISKETSETLGITPTGYVSVKQMQEFIANVCGGRD
jgi:hypothetical protein